MFFGACQSDVKKENNEVVDNRPDIIENVNKAPRYINKCYHHLKGVLGDMKITVDLKEYQIEGMEEVQLSGYYRYDKYGGPIALYGVLNKKGELTLNEQGTLGTEMHTIIGQWTDGGFNGEWISGNDHTHFPVVLSSAVNEALQLKCHFVEDSIKAFPELALSPQASFSAQWLEVDSDNKSLNRFMKNAIQLGMASNQEKNNSRVHVIEQQKRAYFKEYLSEVEMMIDEGVIDTTNNDEGYITMNYDLSLTMDVFYNSSDTLTLGYTYYTYTGGAHGIYGTQVASYDLKSLRQIKLKDVLKNGYEGAVSEALAKAVRIKFELGEDAPLSDVLFDKAIAPNDNFGITDKGIFFIFSPYEIAAYAVGEIELFVSFERIAEFVK